LAKPVLDTIFLSNNPQIGDNDLTGVLFRVDDNNVNKLYLEKRKVYLPNEEGADITIEY
jgi:hypothetical protein